MIKLLRLVALVMVAPAPITSFYSEVAASREPLFRVVDLDRGEAREIELSDGRKVTVELVELEERRDRVLSAVIEASVKVLLNGRAVVLRSALYNLPVTVAGVQIDCPITRGPAGNSHVDHWGLEKDARLRLWPAGSPLLAPGTFRYPVRQRWFATGTSMANEPVSPRPGGKLYYHAGLDIGGAEGMVEVLAATEGLVVSAGTEVLAAYKGPPVEPRYDVVYLLDERGWFYRYSHMQSIEAAVRPGVQVAMGQKIGVLGKEGDSGGWSHLHFEIKSRMPSGRWGTQEAYAFLWEAYQREYRPDVIAVARPHHILWAGETAVLDGSRSWSSSGAIVRYEWLFSDGRVGSGPRIERKYPRPGAYSEVLRVTDSRGRQAYDFASVTVLDPGRPADWPPRLHAAYAPTFETRPGDPVTFKVRAFGMTAGDETWDFGDGSPAVKTRSDGTAHKNARDAYAVTVHRYAKAGVYVARVERTDERGLTAIFRLIVHVERR